jgi:hypothetical protein
MSPGCTARSFLSCHRLNTHNPSVVVDDLELARFAVGLIKSKPVRSVAQTMRQLNRNMRLLFEYLLMRENSRRTSGSHA